ncbi:MAG: DMT family transporter [Hyphomicrobiales bacterium]
MTPQDIKKPQRKPAHLWFVLIFIGIAWGGTAPLSKLAVSTGYHPIGITLWADVIGGLILTCIIFARGRRIPISKGHILFYIACGLLGTALPSSVLYESYKHLPVGVNMIVQSLVPMITIAISVPMRLDHMNLQRGLGLALGILAVILIAAPQTSLPDPSLAIWILLPVIASISYSAENVVIAKYQPSDCDAVTTICGLSWGALIWLIPALIISDGWVTPTSFGPPEQAILGTAILHVVAYVGFVWLIENAGPVFAAQVAYVVTGAGVLFGILFYQESHSYWIWMALALMMIGLSLVKPSKEPSSK